MFWLSVYLAPGFLYCLATWWCLPRSSQKQPEAYEQFKRLACWVYLYILLLWPFVILKSIRDAYWKHRL